MTNDDDSSLPVAVPIGDGQTQARARHHAGIALEIMSAVWQIGHGRRPTVEEWLSFCVVVYDEPLVSGVVHPLAKGGAS